MQTFGKLLLLATLALFFVPMASAWPAPQRCKPDVEVLGEASSECVAVVVFGTAKGGIAVAGFGESEGNSLCVTGSGSAECWPGTGIVGHGCSDSHHDIDPTCPRSMSASSPPGSTFGAILNCRPALDDPAMVICFAWGVGRDYVVNRATGRTDASTVIQDAQIPTCGVGVEGVQDFFRVWGGCFDPSTGENIVWIDSYDYFHGVGGESTAAVAGPLSACGAGVSEMGTPTVWAKCIDPDGREIIVWSRR